MSRKLIVVCAALLISAVTAICADDTYVEDVYFWASEPVKDADGKIVPHFNPKAKEIVFIEPVQQPDTLQVKVNPEQVEQGVDEQQRLQEMPTQR